MSKHVGEKCGKLYFQYFKLKKRHNSYKNWRKLTTLELDLQYSNIKSYAKFQLNMSKYVGEKWDGRTDGRMDTRADGRADITIP